MHDHHNTVDYWTPTLALAVWSAHFTVLWGASIALPGLDAARWIAVAATAAGGAALWWLWTRAGRPGLRTVPGLGLAIVAVGTAYDVVPALIG